MWSFSGPTPLPSRISMVMDLDTTSRDAKSLAVGAYLQVRQGGQQVFSVDEGIIVQPQTRRPCPAAWPQA